MGAKERLNNDGHRRKNCQDQDTVDKHKTLLDEMILGASLVIKNNWVPIWPERNASHQNISTYLIFLAFFSPMVMRIMMG